MLMACQDDSVREMIGCVTFCTDVDPQRMNCTDCVSALIIPLKPPTN